MRYENNNLLREYLQRGAAGPHREHAKHPTFELDAAAFAETLGEVRQQHPHLSEPEAEARTAFRLLTRGALPALVQTLPSPAHHAHEYLASAHLTRVAPDAWRWAKIVWAISLLLLALTAVFLLAIRPAHGATPPRNTPGTANLRIGARAAERASTASNRSADLPVNHPANRPARDGRTAHPAASARAHASIARALVGKATAVHAVRSRVAPARANHESAHIVRADDMVRALVLQPPNLLPQIAGGGSIAARMQFLNGSSAWSSVSSSNPLPITCISGCSGGSGGGGTSSVDEAAFTEGTTPFAPAGGYFKSSITPLTSGEQGTVALTANRAFHITPYGSGGTELFTNGNAAYVQFPAAQPVQAAGNAAVLSGQQAVTASAAALAANTTKTVCIKALAANPIDVYVGASGVTTSTGMELAPGNAYCVPATNTNLFFVVASVTGASVSWVASN